MNSRFSRFAVLTAVLAVQLLLGDPPPAAAGHEMSLKPVGHRLPPPLRVKVWTERGPEAIYSPGERVCVRFTTNDDAYVCVYNIDTEGHVRVLFPSDHHDGFVPGHTVVSLPGPHADFDYVVTGPAGIETIEAIASRAPLADWDGAWEGEDEEWEYDEEYDGDWEGEEEYDRDDDDGEDDDDDEDREDDDDDDRNGSWRAGQRLDGVPTPRPRATGLTVSGDPFVAVRRVNRRLLPSPCEDRDYDTAYVSYYVGYRVRYPRHACNDCHGSYHGYDPYLDHCSVFSVRVNVDWGYPRHHVYVVHRRVLEPRYIYVRHKQVPSPYKHLKRAWSSHDQSRLKKEFRKTPAWKPPTRKMEIREKRAPVPPKRYEPDPGKSKRRLSSPKVARPGSHEAATPRRPGKAETREWQGDGGKSRGRTRDRRESEAAEAPRSRKKTWGVGGKKVRDESARETESRQALETRNRSGKVKGEGDDSRSKHGGESKMKGRSGSGKRKPGPKG